MVSPLVQAVARDCMQQFADVDHTQMLNAAKPRWKARLIQAVQDALEFIGGRSVPEIMVARRSKCFWFRLPDLNMPPP
jgi:hypothetical protein